MIKVKPILLIMIFIVMVQSVCSISNVQHSVNENSVTLTYDGSPPYFINIRNDQDIGQNGGYVWAKTYFNQFTIDLSFANNPSKKFYYGVKEDSWSDTNSFLLDGSDKCVKIFGDSQSSKSMNIFFVGVGYNQGQISCETECNLNSFDKILENDITHFLFNEDQREGFGILSVEPFASNLDKVNVFMLSESMDCDYQNEPYCYFDPNIESLVIESCQDYVKNNPIHVIIGYDDPTTYGHGGWSQPNFSKP